MMISCKGQNTNILNLNKNNMEHFSLDKYRNWDDDKNFSSSNSRKYLKKGNDRVAIYYWDKEIQVLESNIISPYTINKTYHLNSVIKSVHTEFYQIPIGKSKLYDNLGNIIEEIDNDKGYDFDLKSLLLKIKKEYGVNLEDKSSTSYLYRKYDSENTYYEVYLPSKEHILKKDYILISGATGDILYKSYIYIKDKESKLPFEEYKKGIKDNKQKKSSTSYRTYNGKTYTEEEWKAFEEQEYKKYLESKNKKGFWDKLLGD